MWVISFKIINKHCLSLIQKACIMVAIIQNKTQSFMVEATILSQVVYNLETILHLLLSVLQMIFLIRSLYVKSQPIASTSNPTFWWALQTQTEWVVFESARTHHLGLKVWNFDNPIGNLGDFLWKNFIILAS